MFKMSSQVETIVNAYKTLSKIPSVTGGRLNNAGNKITSKWSVRNLDKGKSTKYMCNYTLDHNLNVVAQSDFGVDVSDELLSAVSPQETYKAVIREQKNGKESKKQFLEVWSRNCLAHCIDLTALDIHGDVYADSEFGSLDWNKEENAIVYVAEKKLQKIEPYVKRKADDKPKNDGSGEVSDKPVMKGEEYVYRQDWGEQLVGKHLSVIVVCRLPEEKFTVLEGLPDTWCPGQVCFNGESIIGVAWETEPRRLGLIFCTNRPSFVFNLTLDGVMRKLSADGKAVRSPRVSPSGDIFWLQRETDAPHHAAHALMRLHKNTNEVSTIVDIVATEKNITNGVFHGIFGLSVPKRGFSADGNRMVFSTPQKTEVRSYVVNIDDGRITDISYRNMECSTTVLDVQNDVILATCSNMSTPGQLFVALLPNRGKEREVRWLRVSEPQVVPPSIATSTTEYLHLEHQNTEDTVKSFSAIYFAPSGEGKLPLVVWPHGGPHSNFVNSYSIEAALFNMLGFACLQINYRGSSGAGQDSLAFLLKRAGVADVKDCKLATDEVLKKYPIDEGKLCLAGGSHGGFLVTHLSGQYPDVYKAVAARNPVTDLASMFNSTDIPDWCAAETGFPWTEEGPMSEEHLVAMRRCSPMAHVHKVRAPTAIMLGSGDKRVPHYQGLEYARRLKANGVPTRIYMYDDNHSLSSQPAEMDNLINCAKWFLEHIQS